jgi:hypothetical protein
MYVIHFGIFGVFHLSPLSVSALSANLGSRLAATLIAFTVPFLVTVGLAWLIWVGYESQFLKLKSFFEYGKGKAIAAPTAPLSEVNAQS